MQSVKVDLLLSVEELFISYDNKIAVEHISFSAARGESVALVGSNGAGKTSVLSAVAGLMCKGQRIEGHTSLEGKTFRWGDVKTHIMHGIRLVPEKDKVFSLLTVAENLRICTRGPGKGKSAEAEAFDWFPRLWERRSMLAGNLSGGEQQMLAIAMSLLASPKLLLLDEPTLGLATPIIETLSDRLAVLRKELDLTLIVAESDSQWLPRLADRALIIDRGRLVGTFGKVEESNLDAIHDMLLGITGTRHGGAINA